MTRASPPRSRSPRSARATEDATAGAPAAAQTQEREPRGARRKRETRARLMRAAFQLIGERGVDAIAINDVTEAADVGFGSFYNHFASKDAIYAAVVDAVFGQFADTLDRATASVADPAEVIAICVRQTVLRAHVDSTWGRFFVREALTPAALARGLGPRLLRDIRRAVAAKRLRTADPMMASMLAGGCVLATIAAEAAVVELGASAAEPLGFDADNLASRAAASILEALGLERREAVKLSTKAMPPLDPHASADAFA